MEVIGNTFYFDWEVSLIVWFQTHIGFFGEKLAEFFTYFGTTMVLILVIGLFYWGIDKKFGKYLAVNLFSVSLWGSMIKNIVLRRRPYFDHESVQCLCPAEKGDAYNLSLQGFSFPSLHTAFAMSLYPPVGRFLSKKICKIILWILPFLVGISRFVLGVHYPTDVLAGLAFGVLVTLLIDVLLKKLPDQRWIFVIFLISGIPGFFYCTSTDFYTSYGLILGSAAGFLIEEKYVKFENAKNFLFSLLRLAGGIAIFLASSKLLKLPFSKELLESANTTAFLLRTARYALSSFLIMGVYPFCFNKGKLNL